MNGLRSGDVAEQANVNIETLRFYERRGLLPKPPRLESGHRRYDSGAVIRIRFIKRAQDLGFSLSEIAELLALRDQAPDACDTVRQLATEKMRDIDGRIRDLQRVKQALTRLSDECDSRARSADCPILHSLNGDDHA